MNPSPAQAAAVDLDDAEGLLAADRMGLLRAASMAGAQVRATAAAFDEGELDAVRAGGPPRTIVWVSSRGNACTAGTMLAAVLGGSVGAPIVVVSEPPMWVGALDVLVIAGDDAADPVLVSAAATGVRRGARVVVIAPFEGPLRDVTSGRAAVLPPRVPMPDDFTLTRYLAAGLAVVQAITTETQTDLAAMADELDAEALRNSAGRELFTNPAKLLAEQMSGHDVVFAGGEAATVALARHAATVMLRVAHRTVAAVDLADVLVAIGTGWGRGPAASGFGSDELSIFHDEQIDGPLPTRTRTFVLTSDTARPAISARLTDFDDIYVVDANDVPDVVTAGGNRDVAGTAPTRLEQQLALLALRLEMAAVYQRLVRG